MKTFKINDVDEYIATFPEGTQVLLVQLRSTIKKAAPQAEEVLSYQMPAYKFHGILVYFAGHKHHIGFYPTSSGIEAFKQELSVYKGAKGSVRFPLDQPLPLRLISQIVQFRVIENREKAIAKSKK